jgi:hypothetical protein
MLRKLRHRTHLDLEVAMGRLAGRVDATTFDVELPTVVRAPEAGVLLPKSSDAPRCEHLLRLRPLARVSRKPISFSPSSNTRTVQAGLGSPNESIAGTQY